MGEKKYQYTISQNLCLVGAAIMKANDSPDQASSAILVERTENLKHTLKKILALDANLQEYSKDISSITHDLRQKIASLQTNENPLIQRHVKQAQKNLEELNALTSLENIPSKKRKRPSNEIQPSERAKVSRVVDMKYSIEKLEPLVSDYVGKYLHRYITGEIIPSNEAKLKPNRKPMFDELKDHLVFKGIQLSKKELKSVQKMAYKACIRQAIMGAYTYQNIPKKETCQTLKITEDGPLMNKLFPTIVKALYRDFPEMKVKGRHIYEGLSKMNKMRTRIEAEALDYHQQMPTGRKQRIASYLAETGKLFVDEKDLNL